MSGKFSVAQDNSINLTIITSVHILLDKNDISTMKPTVQLLGKAMNHAQLTEVGYTLQIQVKPYLSKEQFNTFLINLTHPPNGRFKNALVKVKKSSTIHATGLLFFADKQIYCEILEFQFISTYKETESISVPWKSKTESRAESSSPSSKSTIERRIDLVRQNLATKPPSPTNSPVQNRKNKRDLFNLKISDVSKSLQNQQENEIHDSQEKTDDEIEEIVDKDKIDEIEEEATTRKSKRVRSKK